MGSSTTILKRGISGLIILIMLAIIAYWIYYIAHTKSPQKHHPATTTPTVTLKPLGYHNIPETVISYGTTTSPQSTPLKSQIGGTIASIEFKPGQQVTAGQILFTLLSSDIGNQTKKLYAQMQSSKSIYERQARANRLFPGTIDASTVETSKLRYEQDKAAYLQSRVVEHVSAPANGIVSDTDLAVGSYVTAGEPLVNFVNPYSLQIKYQLPANYAQQVKLGQPVNFYPNNNKTAINATVAYIAPLLNHANYNLTLRANFTQHSSLPQNSFGRIVQVLNPHYKVLALPQKIVQTDASGFYAYTVENHKISKLYFTPGQVTRSGLIEINSGIKANTPIVISNVLGLTLGQTVKVATK